MPLYYACRSKYYALRKVLREIKNILSNKVTTEHNWAKFLTEDKYGEYLIL